MANRRYIEETLTNGKAYMRLLFTPGGIQYFQPPFLPKTVDEPSDIYLDLHSLYARLPEKIFHAMGFEL
jgi:hypothetical protein